MHAPAWWSWFVLDVNERFDTGRVVEVCCQSYEKAAQTPYDAMLRSPGPNRVVAEGTIAAATAAFRLLTGEAAHG